MRDRARRMAALAAVIAGPEAARLLASFGPEGDAARYGAMARRPRRERLDELAASLAPRGARGVGAATWPPLLQRLARDLEYVRSGFETPVRGADPPLGREPPAPCVDRASSDGTLLGNAVSAMSLPFPLQRISPGFAHLLPEARRTGRALADTAASALAASFATPVQLAASPLPAPAEPGPGTARVAIALDGVCRTATLEVEVAFLARALEAVAGGADAVHGALVETAAERALLDLATLVVLDAAAPLVGIDLLHPRLAASGAHDPHALAISLELTVGRARGTGRLFVPDAALRALSGSTRDDLSPELAGVAVSASFRDGATSLARSDLAAIEAGDVLLLDDEPPLAALVFPGGLMATGHVAGEHLHVEEIRMTETQASYPLTVAVEIGRVTLTLGEISRLEPGGAVPLDLRRDGAVVLRAGERAIARGHLVDIAGAMGVRIAEVGERP